MNASENAADGQETDIFCMPWMTMKLTDKGFQNIDKIIIRVGEYLNMMQQNDIPEDYYNDHMKIEELNFKYADEIDDESLTDSIAMNMNYVRPENIIKSACYRVPLIKDSKYVKELLNYF